MQPGWNRFGPGRGGLAALALAVCYAISAAGEEPEAKAAPPPAVDMDRLLKLPTTVEITREQIGGATRSQWRARFASARAEHEAAVASLEASQKKLGTVAEQTDSWQIAPPGSGANGPSEAPVDYQLKQDMRRQREDLTRSEKNLKELTIEADLAGVPADWRE